MNYFHLRWDEVLWEMDYLNLGMLSATVPTMDDEDDNSPEGIAAMFNKQTIENHLG